MSSWPDLAPALPWIITSVSVAYVAWLHYKLRQQHRLQRDQQMNPDQLQRKHVLKVGHDIEKGKRLSLCRCWRSKTFPLCDGAHKDFNRETGECVGAVNIVWDEDEDDQTKTLVDQMMDIQSMNASTELSSLEMIDSNGENGSSRDSPHSAGDDSSLLDN